MISNKAYIFPLWNFQKLHHNPNHLFLEKSVSLNRVIDCIRVKGSNFKFVFQSVPWKPNVFRVHILEYDNGFQILKQGNKTSNVVLVSGFDLSLWILKNNFKFCRISCLFSGRKETFIKASWYISFPNPHFYTLSRKIIW